MVIGETKEQTMDLVQVLTEHQWEFDSRHFCKCGAAIEYESPYSDDRAMAEHQVEVAQREMPDLCQLDVKAVLSARRKA